MGFTSVSRSYYYSICVDEVPAPRSRPTIVRQGNGGYKREKKRDQRDLRHSPSDCRASASSVRTSCTDASRSLLLGVAGSEPALRHGRHTGGGLELQICSGVRPCGGSSRLGRLTMARSNLAIPNLLVIGIFHLDTTVGDGMRDAALRMECPRPMCGLQVLHRML